MGNIKMDEIPVTVKVMADGKFLSKRHERYCPEQGIGFDKWDKFHVGNKFYTLSTKCVELLVVKKLI